MPCALRFRTPGAGEQQLQSFLFCISIKLPFVLLGNAGKDAAGDFIKNTH